MKRIIGFFLIFSVLICSLGAGFVSSAQQEEGNIQFSLSFDRQTVTQGDILEVTVNMKNSYESFLLGGISFDIKYEYNGPSRFNVPLSFELLQSQMVYDEKFSNQLQVGERYEGSYVIKTFTSVPEATFDEDEISITFPFLVKETLYEGQYSFALEVNALYTIDLGAEDIAPSLNYTVEGEDFPEWSGYPIWLGQCKTMTLTGENISGEPIYIDKKITNSDELYIENVNIAVFDDNNYENGIQNFDDYAFVYVKGISIGETELYLISEYDTTMQVFAIKINVTKPGIYSFKIESQPDKTEYYVGEKIDLAGLKLRIEYNNMDVIYISSGFELKEYDFSTVGEKSVDIYYTDKFYDTICLKVKFNVVGLFSERYKFDNTHVYNIPLKTCVEDFISNTEISGQIKFYDNSEELSEGYLKTGMKIKVYSGEKLVKEFTVAVTKDLNGDNRVNIKDLVILKKITAGIEAANETDFRVLGVESEEELNAESLIIMQKQVLGVR